MHIIDRKIIDLLSVADIHASEGDCTLFHQAITLLQLWADMIYPYFNGKEIESIDEELEKAEKSFIETNKTILYRQDPYNGSFEESLRKGKISLRKARQLIIANMKRANLWIPIEDFEDFDSLAEEALHDGIH